MIAPAPLRVLELYAGLGGAAAALAGLFARDSPSRFESVGAVDIDRVALDVHARNFGHPTFAKLVDSLPPAWLEARRADLWWASPPCQPFTRRGRRRALDDPRAKTFQALLGHLDAVRPSAFALENVVGFDDSPARAALLRTLDAAGYRWREAILCPSELGVPNRRPRYYVAASRRGEPEAIDRRPIASRRPLAAYLDHDSSIDPEALRVDPELVRRYPHALSIVDADDPDAVTSCFTAAYGRSTVRSGSYLRLEDGGLRRFSPAEILRLLGFPSRYALPTTLRLENAWRLAGNSLSIEPVRRVLTSLAEVRELGPAPIEETAEEIPC